MDRVKWFQGLAEERAQQGRAELDEWFQAKFKKDALDKEALERQCPSSEMFQRREPLGERFCPLDWLQQRPPLVKTPALDSAAVEELTKTILKQSCVSPMNDFFADYGADSPLFATHDQFLIREIKNREHELLAIEDPAVMQIVLATCFNKTDAVCQRFFREKCTCLYGRVFGLDQHDQSTWVSDDTYHRSAGKPDVHCHRREFVTLMNQLLEKHRQMHRIVKVKRADQ